ncbi:hypothetical protein HOK76_06915 [archaeon]|jgi:hypothetical protein|nr:hypothetical protein [archaeon]MBT5424201.1 hypothetical protein [archaeon]
MIKPNTLLKTTDANDFFALPYRFSISEDDENPTTDFMDIELLIDKSPRDYNGLQELREATVTTELSDTALNNGGLVAPMGVSAEIFLEHENDIYVMLGYHERVNPEFTDRVFKLPSTYVLERHSYRPDIALRSILEGEIIISSKEGIHPLYLDGDALDKPFNNINYTKKRWYLPWTWRSSENRSVNLDSADSVLMPGVSQFSVHFDDGNNEEFMGVYGIQPNEEFVHNMQLMGAYTLYSKSLPDNVSIQHIEPKRVKGDILEHRISETPIILAKLDSNGKLNGTYWTMIDGQMERYDDSHLKPRIPLSERFVPGNPALSDIVTEPRISRKEYQHLKFGK